MKLLPATTLGVLLVLCLSAYAQPQPSAEVRALQTRINDLNNSCNGYATAAYQLQDKLNAVEAEVKRLTDKYEPKPPTDGK